MEDKILFDVLSSCSSEDIEYLRKFLDVYLKLDFEHKQIIDDYLESLYKNKCLEYKVIDLNYYRLTK